MTSSLNEVIRILNTIDMETLEKDIQDLSDLLDAIGSTDYAETIAEIRARLAYLEKITAGPILYSHRGMYRTPGTWDIENTCAAIGNAHTCGFNGVEIDVQHDVNGVVVALHDGTVDRVAVQTGAIGSLDYRNVFYKDKLGAATEYRLETLRDVFTLCKQLNMHILIDGHYIDGEYITPIVSMASIKQVMTATGIDHSLVAFYEFDPTELAQAPADCLIYTDLDAITEASMASVYALYPGRDRATIGVRYVLEHELDANDNSYIRYAQANAIPLVCSTLEFNPQLAMKTLDNDIVSFDAILDFPYCNAGDQAAMYRRAPEIITNGPTNHRNSSNLSTFMSDVNRFDQFFGVITSANQSWNDLVSTTDVYGSLVEGMRGTTRGRATISSLNANRPYEWQVVRDLNEDTNLFAYKTGAVSIASDIISSCLSSSANFPDFIHAIYESMDGIELCSGYITDSKMQAYFGSSFSNWYGGIFVMTKPIWVATATAANKDTFVGIIFGRNMNNLHAMLFVYNGTNLGTLVL